MTPPIPRFPRPVGRLVAVGLALVLLFSPAYLFSDFLRSYRLHSDDFAYVGASRTFPRAVSNLFVPHNTHIVPAWRLLTCGLVSAAGGLGSLQTVLAGASYAILAAVMLLTGRLVTRETRSEIAGLVAMATTGTTSLMTRPATWYSAGQTLWSGFGILMTLWYVQGWRRLGKAWWLAAAAAAAWFAGGMWTIGHVAGPAAAAYLLADGRPQARRAALVPLLATLAAVALALGLGGRRIDSRVSFHGRDVKGALDLSRGATHTLQAIPEDLVFGNLGLRAETTPLQGAVLSAGLATLWAWTLRRAGRPSPLEAAGGVIVLVGYYVEWVFRGYLPFSSLRGIVPWYDTIPHLGAVLFGAGWWGRLRDSSRAPDRLTWRGVMIILALEAALLAIHQPRVDALFLQLVPKMSEAEAKVYVIPSLQRLRAVALAEEIARWQRRHLIRLDRAEAVARRMGIGRDSIAKAFGRVNAPELPEAYDAVTMLDLPGQGTESDPVRAQAALFRLFAMEPEPSLPLPDLSRQSRR